jgi:hypothetical protein
VQRYHVTLAYQLWEAHVFDPVCQEVTIFRDIMREYTAAKPGCHRACDQRPDPAGADYSDGAPMQIEAQQAF